MSKATSIVLAALLCATVAGAQAQDVSKFPDWKGQWSRLTPGTDPQWDPSKPAGRGQQPPLTAEYQKIWEATLARQESGAPRIGTCIPPGMPRSMIAYDPFEIIVMPDTTYVMLSYMSEFRRIFTDGRKWPDDIEPSYAGYSIGKWIDENGDGKYDVLEVETRGLKSGRTFDGSGIPMHEDAETVVKERIYLDKSDQNVLHDEVTVSDHALTHPWTVNQRYTRDRKGEWTEFVCSEENHYVNIGKETYDVSADGFLKPTRKDQPPPDLKYFKAK